MKFFLLNKVNYIHIQFLRYGGEKMKVTIKNKDKYIEKIERAEALLKELKDIFAWDLSGEIEVETEEK